MDNSIANLESKFDNESHIQQRLTSLERRIRYCEEKVEEHDKRIADNEVKMENAENDAKDIGWNVECILHAVILLSGSLYCHFQGKSVCEYVLGYLGGLGESKLKELKKKP